MRLAFFRIHLALDWKNWFNTMVANAQNLQRQVDIKFGYDHAM